MGQFDLPFLVREKKSFGALQHAEAPGLETRGMLTATNSFAASFNADHPHISILEKGMEQADGVAAAADARDEQVRQALFAFENLAARFNADDALKIAYHHRVRVRAQHGAQYIMCGAHVRDPIAHRFVDRFFERGLAGGDWNNFRAEKFHTRDVQRLPFHIDLAHINHAFATEPGGDRGTGNAVLTGSGFSDDTALSHSLREQDLSERVIAFVR